MNPKTPVVIPEESTKPTDSAKLVEGFATKAAPHRFAAICKIR
jgi:hypothetical protein